MEGLPQLQGAGPGEWQVDMLTASSTKTGVWEGHASDSWGVGGSLDPQALVGGYQWEQRGHLVSSWGPQGPYFPCASVSACIQSVRGGLVILGRSVSLLPFGGLWALSLSLKEWLMPLLLRTLCSGHSRPRVVTVTAYGKGARVHQGVSWEELENEERAQNEPGPFCPPKLEQGSNAPSTRATVLPPRLPGPKEWMPRSAVSQH